MRRPLPCVRLRLGADRAALQDPRSSPSGSPPQGTDWYRRRARLGNETPCFGMARRLEDRTSWAYSPLAEALSVRAMVQVPGTMSSNELSRSAPATASVAVTVDVKTRRDMNGCIRGDNETVIHDMGAASASLPGPWRLRFIAVLPWEAALLAAVGGGVVDALAERREAGAVARQLRGRGGRDPPRVAVQLQVGLQQQQDEDLQVVVRRNRSPGRDSRPAAAGAPAPRSPPCAAACAAGGAAWATGPENRRARRSARPEPAAPAPPRHGRE